MKFGPGGLGLREDAHWQETGPATDQGLGACGAQVRFQLATYRAFSDPYRCRISAVASVSPRFIKRQLDGPDQTDSAWRVNIEPPKRTLRGERIRDRIPTSSSLELSAAILSDSRLSGNGSKCPQGTNLSRPNFGKKLHFWNLTVLVPAQLHGRILDQKTTAQAVNATEGRAALAVERLISLHRFPQAVLHALGYCQLCTVPHISARQLLPPDTLRAAHMLDGASKIGRAHV